MAGTWDPTNPPKLPGLYANFEQAASSALLAGARGIVAMPLSTYSGTAAAKTFYKVTVDTLTDAEALFGAANTGPIEFVLSGGAREVLVYTMPATPVSADFIEMRNAYDTQLFNVFVFDGEETSTEQDATLDWVQASRDDGKHFMVVFGGSDADDLVPATGNARSVRLADDYAVNLINGVTIDGASFNSSEYAPYIAGLIAGTAINKSTTYKKVSATDVTRRLRKADQTTALENGSLVLIHDGEKVKILSGVTTSKSKIRTQRARQAIATDLAKRAADDYIGKIDNTEAGQVTLMGAMELYLRQLETENVLTGPTVELDPQRVSSGDQIFVVVSFTEVDSIEKIYVTINV